MWGEQDRYLFREGTHARLYQHLGAHMDAQGVVHFAVWAPNAQRVSVIGDWNGWNPEADPMTQHDDSGVWQVSIGIAHLGQRYKYRILGRDGHVVDKADPMALQTELPPDTSSRIARLEYQWRDQAWMRERGRRNALNAPIAVYEVHAGSWRRPDGVPMGWRELARALGEYVQQLGFTHVELMPVTEHPFYGSWGYQTTGYFAPTARYGSPQDFMYFVDHLHELGIGVILDWVPSHFPTDAHGLQFFDGTHLYEHADPRQGFHPEWNSSIFNYGRGEVSSFLISSALFWLDRYHIDALRVDAVASMLYLDYARRDGEWIPNQYGGHENLEAIAFLRRLNEAVYREFPDTQTIAEESTAWPMVSRPTAMGGLGFGMKWNMGWMHDTLAFMQEDPVHRRYHLGKLSFSLVYAFSENFVLPLSHDEVVYGKGSLIRKMPGDDWQRFANLRTLLAWMWTHPGKKLLFMGGEFGQWREWTHEGELDWGLTQQPLHAGVQRLVADLNRLLRTEPALHELDFGWEGFQWLEAQDAERTLLAFLRRPATRGAKPLLVACNFTPVPRENVLLGVPARGTWRELLNTDAEVYGGSGWGNLGRIESRPLPAHGLLHSIRVVLPPLAVIVLQHESYGQNTIDAPPQS
ncbi:1,4-alpha-glucan branching protein GlgB [Azohydromonas caseinilytica]|uniref:1,4-alpha-glucan branching enzyme GlgB n=1 Tax=Azohydromonas caseinilytica TaxID=2728836 RepID=A0A848F7J0_9BURK|nr:1,4-alpha-glucan branching protein GlgB [Azohydromonas caseinilytica]NML16067.1 1,4-alpha-glucan branching protein GlgB [Azohydromonas caseinilytica]